MNGDIIFRLGVLGGFILVLGSIWVDKPVKNPRNSVKNWLFALGGLVLFFYALLNYLYASGTLFFAILEILSVVASVLMLGGFPAKFSTRVIGAVSLVLIVWSVFLSQNYQAVIFILGLAGVAWGYVLPSATFQRNFLLAISSLLIAFFSYLGRASVFFWLNIFFAVFSFFYAWKACKK